jgi:hypothetical protein
MRQQRLPVDDTRAGRPGEGCSAAAVREPWMGVHGPAVAKARRRCTGGCGGSDGDGNCGDTKRPAHASQPCAALQGAWQTKPLRTELSTRQNL